MKRTMVIIATWIFTIAAVGFAAYQLGIAKGTATQPAFQVGMEAGRGVERLSDATDLVMLGRFFDEMQPPFTDGQLRGMKACYALIHRTLASHAPGPESTEKLEQLRSKLSANLGGLVQRRWSEMP